MEKFIDLFQTLLLDIRNTNDFTEVDKTLSFDDWYSLHKDSLVLDPTNPILKGFEGLFNINEFITEEIRLYLGKSTYHRLLGYSGESYIINEDGSKTKLIFS